MTGILIKRGNLGHKDSHEQREDNVKTHGKHPLQTKKCLRLSQARREAGNILPHSPQKEPTPADTLASGF